jgi:methionine-rich copper-binding protein CopC
MVTSNVMSLRLSTLLALASAVLFANPAHAHAYLDHTTPAANSALHQSPTEIKLWFSGQLDPPFTKAEVQDQSGKRVDKDDSQVDDADPKLLRLSLPPLAPGKYRVTWRAVSVDTHASSGEFTFDIAP